MRVEQAQQAGLVGIAGAVNVKSKPRTSFANVLSKAGDVTGGTNTPAEETKKAARPLPKGPKGEATRAVEGHPAYVEIVSGPRNGMFINVTSNERRGEAFVLVRKDDRDLHIYGTGKDRRVIISWHKDEPDHKTDAAKEARKDAKPSTGGAAAPKS
jgi:hypothetical protein